MQEISTLFTAQELLAVFHVAEMDGNRLTATSCLVGLYVFRADSFQKELSTKEKDFISKSFFRALEFLSEKKFISCYEVVSKFQPSDIDLEIELTERGKIALTILMESKIHPTAMVFKPPYTELDCSQGQAKEIWYSIQDQFITPWTEYYYSFMPEISPELN